MPQETQTAKAITKQSKSNLAFALTCLPKNRREDLVTFYAFCRIIDDIADDLVMANSEKIKGFEYWKKGLNEGFNNKNEVENDILKIRDKYHIPNELFLELIHGCEMDLEPMRFQTWEDLQEYTYRVACVVGLISLHIFGADPKRSEQYALKLGHALQLTNIIRDVGEDLENGERIYLPIEDLEKFGYTEADLKKRTYDDRFKDIMKYQCQRARSLYQEAHACLPTEDQKALKAAKIMGEIYFSVLEKIEREGYAIFHQRVSISKGKKVFLLLKGMLF